MHVLMLALLICLACLLVTAAPLPAQDQAADFFVSPEGNDDWSGRLAAPTAARTDGPFATVERAQAALRQLRAADPAAARTVLIRGGVYRLDEPLRFTPEDSGTEQAPTVYAAYPGETPVFSGGSPISGWRRGEGELWVAHVPEVEAGEWYFHQLFVNGRRATRARTPNFGDYHRIAGLLEPMPDRAAARSAPAPRHRIGFEFHEGDIQPWDGLADVNIILYHAWTASVHWIDEVDMENRTVRFTNPSGWPVGYWEGNARYYVENFREALDTPGEWYLDRATGTVYYWPREGEDMTTAEVVAPRLQHLALIQGDTQAGLPVSHLVLRGLSFRHADWKHDRSRIADGQAAVHLSAAVVATGALDCVLEDCEIAYVGEYGLILGEGCKRNRVFRSHIHDLGGGGVRLGETVLHPEPERQTSHNVVDNCFIHDGGHVFQAGIGVWIGRSSHNTISHNDICDFYYSGCSVGWSWGYAASTANHNVFEYNHIHNIGKFVLSDMGAIYSLGLSPGTVMRYNLIHDIYSYSYGGWGLYTDEGSTGIVMENNVVYNTKTGGFHQHYGRENQIRNNIFAFAHEANIIRSRQEDHSSFTFERNILLTHNHRPLGGNWGNDNYDLNHNLYWDITDPRELEFAGLSFEEWQARGRDEGSLIADPLFVDPVNHDFRLRENSPAFALGFQSFDISDVGLYGDPEWVNLPQAIAREPVPLPSPPQPEPFADDFEDTPVGERPRMAAVSGEDEEKGSSIRVTDEQSAGGNHSLKFTDAEGLPHDWQPHMRYAPRFTRGVARLAFDVMVEPGAIFWHEWRTGGHPYQVGPTLRIEADGELKASGRTLLTVPHGQWVRIEMTCKLGRLSTGAYDITVTLAGQAPRAFEDIPFGSEAFRRLEWVGFISLATERTVFYLDNLRLDWEEG